jgi:hypothetical protein
MDNDSDFIYNELPTKFTRCINNHSTFKIIIQDGKLMLKSTISNRETRTTINIPDDPEKIKDINGGIEYIMKSLYDARDVLYEEYWDSMCDCYYPPANYSKKFFYKKDHYENKLPSLNHYP